MEWKMPAGSYRAHRAYAGAPGTRVRGDSAYRRRHYGDALVRWTSATRPTGNLWIAAPLHRIQFDGTPTLSTLLMRHTLGAALLASALATTAVPAQDTRDLLRYVDSAATAAVAEKRTAGVSVAVVKNGRTILAKGYGFADLENDVPATAETVYRIGSITKQFTSAAIMKLMEQGKLSLDDTLQKFLPNFPTHGNRVTVRHLLNHTSGIKSYTSLGPKWARVIRLDLAPDSLVALFANEPFDFKPGDAYRYNNSGYFLLGMIIEKLSGKWYGQYLQDEFFTPLGLKSTMYCDQAPLIKHRAQGYAPRPGGGFINAEPLSMTQPYAAGSLCSTVNDLVVWAQALSSGKVVSPASYKLMTTPVTLNDGKPIPYGFGLGTGMLGVHRQVSHNGGINGFVSELHHYPDDSVVTVVLTNTGASAAVQLERLVARRALGIKDLPAVPIDAAALQRLVGEYATGNTRVRVFVEAGRLRVQQQGNPAFGLKHVGGGRFVRDDNDDVQFEFPAGTPAPSIVRHQGGTVTTATRVP
jgi:D-alanyl-D-alanine carboxypeptidase